MPKILAIALLLLLTACDFGRSTSRIVYWQDETSKNLPIGTSKSDAEKFFRDRGIELGCCISGPDMKNSYLATEKNIGRELFMEYNVTIVVDFKDDKVARVRVMRLGAGL